MALFPNSVTMQPEDPTPEKPLSPEVVGQLVQNHREFLAFLERRVGSRALAEDILQESFVRGLSRLGSLENSESATAWFYRILRNSVIDHQRRLGATHRKLEAFAAELETNVSSEPTRDAVCRCVARIAETLKPEYSEALRRVELDGIPVKDFAREAGISSNNAAVRVFRAREALRKQLARSCGTCAEHGCLDCTCEPSRSSCC